MLTKQHQYRIKTASKRRQSFFAFHSASLQNFHVTPQLHLVQVMFFFDESVISYCNACKHRQIQMECFKLGKNSLRVLTSKFGRLCYEFHCSFPVQSAGAQRCFAN